MLTHGVVDAEEQGLLVEGLAMVADKDAGDLDDAVEKEDGGGGFRGEVPTGGVGVAEANVEVGGVVGLTLG